MGFQAFERQNIAVGVSQDVAVDIVLQPGSQTQTVTITEELPLVNTTSAVFGGTLNNQTINDLPMSGRNYINLLSLRPGVVMELGNNATGGGATSTNGLREESSNSYAVEGLSGMDPYTGQSVTNLIGVNGDAAALLPLDAIQEFNQQFNSKAEYGAKAGSNVTIGLKSGTNAVHGTAYSFFRSTRTDAKNYYNPYDTVNGVKTPINIGASLYQPGGTIGGPIKKDKMFYFLGFEFEHADMGNPTSIEAFFTDPSMLNCTGVNASYGCTPKQGLFPNILGGGSTPDASNDATLACLALRNAGTQPSTQSLFMLGMDQFCQLPGGTSARGVTYAAGQVNPDFFVNHGANDHGAQGPNNPDINTMFPNNTTSVYALGGIAKYDWTLNDKHSLNAFYYQGQGRRFDSLGSQPSGRYAADFQQYSRMVAGTWTWLANSTIANSFRVGYASMNEPNFAVDEEEGFTAAQLGLNTGVTRAGQLGVGQAITPTGFYSIGSRETDLQGSGSSVELNDAVSYLHGNHSFKFGGSMIADRQDDSIAAFGKGQFVFGTDITNGLVSFLVGTQAIPNASGSTATLNSGGGAANTTIAVNSGAKNVGLQNAQLLYGNPFVHAHRFNFAGFVQDDWRVTKRFSVNLGLRYDYSTPLTSTGGVMGSFDPTKPGGLVQEGINTKTLYKSPGKNFGPRAGFAWDMFGNGKTVLRLGAGIVYELITLRTYLEVGNNQGLAGVPTGFITGCSGTVSAAIPAGALNNCNGTLTTPGGTRSVGQVQWSVNSNNVLGNILWDRPNPSAQTIFPDPNNVLLNCNPLIQTKDTAASSPRAGSQCLIPAIDPNLTNPYVETWNLGIQHQITNGILLDLSYVGNHGVNLLDKRNLNQAPEFIGWNSAGGAVLKQACLTQMISSACKNPDPAINAAPTAANPTAANLRPYGVQFPWISDVTQVINGDTSNYNALQTSVTLRNFHGLSSVTGYTWSHALSIADANNGSPGTDAYNLSVDYGAASSDLRHRFSIAPTYSFPSMKGFHGLLEGWKLNGTFAYQTGRPLSFTSTGSTADFAGMNGSTTTAYRWDLTGNSGDFTTNYAANVGVVRNPKLAQYYPGCATTNATDPTCANLIYTSPANLQAAQHPAGNAPVNGKDINARTGQVFTAADMAVNNPTCVKDAASLATLRAFGCWVQGGSVLTPPALGTFGNSSKNQFHGLPFWQADASVVKRQKMTERFSGEFRFEVFNFFNHPNFAQPSGTIGTSCTATSCAFQTITRTPDVAATNPIIGAGGPRRMQFGVKIIF